jgi:hypothetical protein
MWDTVQGIKVSQQRSRRAACPVIDAADEIPRSRPPSTVVPRPAEELPSRSTPGTGVRSIRQAGSKRAITGDRYDDLVELVE